METTKRVKVVRKPSLIDTLKTLPLGIPHLFSTRDFKIQSARNAIAGLRKLKMEFIITEEDMVSEYKVTRLK